MLSTQDPHVSLETPGGTYPRRAEEALGHGGAASAVPGGQSCQRTLTLHEQSSIKRCQQTPQNTEELQWVQFMCIAEKN